MNVLSWNVMRNLKHLSCRIYHNRYGIVLHVYRAQYVFNGVWWERGHTEARKWGEGAAGSTTKKRIRIRKGECTRSDHRLLMANWDGNIPMKYFDYIVDILWFSASTFCVCSSQWLYVYAGANTLCTLLIITILFVNHNNTLYSLSLDCFTKIAWRCDFICSFDDSRFAISHRSMAIYWRNMKFNVALGYQTDEGFNQQLSMIVSTSKIIAIQTTENRDGTYLRQCSRQRKGNATEQCQRRGNEAIVENQGDAQG